jgi:hypothetical protein
MPIHPQTDRLSEISNKQVTRYLQAFTTHHQNQWDTMSPLAEYTYNTSVHCSPDRSLVEFDPGYSPSMALDFLVGQRQYDEMQSLEGAVFVECLQASFQHAQDPIHKAQDRQTVAANRSEGLRTLQVEQFVMVSTKDLAITYLNQDPWRWKL